MCSISVELYRSRYSRKNKNANLKKGYGADLDSIANLL